MDDIEATATRRMSRKAWAYYFSASDDLFSKRLNDTTLLSHPVNIPFYVSPVAQARLGHPDGGLGIAQACAKYGVCHIISNAASQSPEQTCAAALPTQIFGWQLYVHVNRQKSEDMLARISKIPAIKFLVLIRLLPPQGTSYWGAMGGEPFPMMDMYGCIPGSNAAIGYNKQNRAIAGHKNSVIHVAYMACLLPPQGTSYWGAMGGEPFPMMDMSRQDEGLVGLHPSIVQQKLFNDLPDEEAEYWVSKLILISFNALRDQTMQVETWRYIRSSYLITGNDAAGPAQFQEALVETADRESFDRVETIDAGHSAFHKKPIELANFLRKAAGEIL
ncbi:MAG: Cytochrome b5 domain-containing protein 1 [Cyphobasidiales sp. Tagirdzhanova-0007]|nr:MAG: Cytochrome b5 domain-containing protein 1 [Cyphobasidiales sp. Tagirdzhanova-0007]